MIAAHANVYRLLAKSALLSVALKEGKAQKSSDFRAKSAYGHCIKDSVFIDPVCGLGCHFNELQG